MNTINRRKFLGLAGLTGLGLGLAACGQQPPASPTAMAGMGATTPTSGGPTADEMDAMHKKGIDTFVANAGKDPIFWRKPLEYKMDGDTNTCTIRTITLLNRSPRAYSERSSSSQRTRARNRKWTRSTPWC